MLLRAGEVVDGLDLARERRGAPRDRDLARGPARLCSALGLDRAHDGIDLVSGAGAADAPGQPADAVSTGPRVGLRGAPDRPWRFWLDGGPDGVRLPPGRRVPGPRPTPDLGRPGAGVVLSPVARSGSRWEQVRTAR